MHILIADKNGRYFSVRKNDIKRVSESGIGTTVSFTNKKENNAIFVKESVLEFHRKYLTKK